jgi:hypothetical protein
MAGEDEIIQKFRVQDDGAVQTLTNIDKQMQNVRTTTANLNSTVKEHGGSITQLGEKMVGLGERHMNARHAIMLFSESTGVARGGIMTMMQSMMMMGTPIGAAVGGFILMKQHLEGIEEQAKKSAEAMKELTHATADAGQERNKATSTMLWGPKATEQEEITKKAQASMDKIVKEMGEMEKTGLGKIMEKHRVEGTDKYSVGKYLLEQAGYGKQDALDYISKMQALNALMAPQKTEVESSSKLGGFYKSGFGVNEDARKSSLFLDEKLAQSHGLDLETQERLLKVEETRVNNMISLADEERDAQKNNKGRVDEATLNELDNENIKARIAYYEKLGTLEDKKYERTIRLKNISESPGVYATTRQKAEYAENDKFEKEKHEAQKIGGDIAALTQNHNDRLTQIKDAEMRELDTKEGANHVLRLQNQNDFFNASLWAEYNHYQESLSAHKGNTDLLKLDEETHIAEAEKLKKENNEKTLSFEAQMREETLRIKGDAFGAEKDQLDEWHRKELLEHKEQADKINDLYKVKDTDLQRRRGQDFADKSQGYQNAITSATQGSMMAQIQNLTYEHNKAQSEYKRVGTPEAIALAALEGQSYKAKIQEMQKESAHKLMGEQKVGFMDAGSAWETFSRGLNQDPFKMEQREREIEANNLLTSIDLKLGNKPVLVG